MFQMVGSSTVLCVFRNTIVYDISVLPRAPMPSIAYFFDVVTKMSDVVINSAQIMPTR